MTRARRVVLSLLLAFLIEGENCFCQVKLYSRAFLMLAYS